MKKIDFIRGFLKDLACNNDRTWFRNNKLRYEEANGYFEEFVQALTDRIAVFDKSVMHLKPKDCMYRIYRDTRFSEDKSPYKIHLGAFINACGKHSLHGGYYLHLQPGSSFMAVGTYCLPSPILRAVRQSVVDNIDEFRNIVENEEFKRNFPVIGMNHLKTMPAGFSRDFPFPEYLRPKDYVVYQNLPDGFFRKSDWLERTAELFRLSKPFNDFVNYTIDNR